MTDQSAAEMSCDCTPAGAMACPTCGQWAKPVPGQTIKALLLITLRVVRDTPYFFCRTEGCPVVYFSGDGRQVVTRDQVRERVYQKEPQSAAVLICYCFQHTVGHLRGGSADARTAILEDIERGVAAGQCACDLRNPQGSCCLGNVRRLIRTAAPA